MTTTILREVHHDDHFASAEAQGLREAVRTLKAELAEAARERDLYRDLYHDIWDRTNKPAKRAS